MRKWKNYPKETKREIRERAERTFQLSLTRTKRACPEWARRDAAIQRRIFKVYKLAAIKNHYAKYQQYHVDHIVPLVGRNEAGEHVVCGLHLPWNLDVIPATTNYAKRTMLVQDWARRNLRKEKERDKPKREKRPKSALKTRRELLSRPSLSAVVNQQKKDHKRLLAVAKMKTKHALAKERNRPKTDLTPRLIKIGSPSG